MMGYQIRLANDGAVCKVDAHEEGGTYIMGGSPEAELSMTYNYSQVYALLDWHPAKMDGRKALTCIPELETVVEKLGTKQYAKDYWAPTPGNAGHAMNIVLGWCRQHPKAKVEVSV